MARVDRRKFLAAAGVSVAASRRAFSAVGANERIVLGVIGCGGRGVQLGRICQSQPDATVAYVCDPDRHRAERAREAVGADHAVADMRRIFDDRAVDAVLIATCDHWHTPAAILACKAGKHVYVEKPCSHNLREGRLLVEAARKYDVVVQHGTQRRSSRSFQQAMALLREGAIGRVLVAKHVNSQKRANIAHRQPSTPPDYLDYDLWVGPAEWRDYQSNFVHYHWHWFYNFGTGDIGNDGVHGIDVARWGLGVETHPSFITGYGSKLYFDDDQEFPDTYTITYEYPGSGKLGEKRLLIYEQRIWSPYRENAEGDNLFFYGTEGMLVIGGEMKLFAPNNKLLRREKISLDGDAHQRDFLDAIKDRSRRPNAEIQIGHLSASLCHLGNIVARVGRAVRFDPQAEQILGDEEAGALLSRRSRRYRKDHWAVPRLT